MDYRARIQRCLAATGLSLVAASVHAAPGALATFELTLTIDRFLEAFAPCDTGAFGCIGVGDTFRGRFAVETAILATDGRNDTAAIHDLYMPFGQAVFSTGSDNTALAGFSRFGGTGGAAMGPASGPSFRILSGRVVDLGGSFNGNGAPWGCCGFTFPFIHFEGVPPHVPANRFDASDQHSLVQGSVRVAPAVPEPGTLLMWLAGAGALAAIFRAGRPPRDTFGMARRPPPNT